MAGAADGVPPDTDVGWTGRTMKVPWFAEHTREELVLHDWDFTGDNAEMGAPPAQPWMTTHSVVAVGRPLLVKGAKRLRSGERVDARLRVPDTDDVVMRAEGHDTSIELAPAEGPATIETDAAARVLLWGRRPADPARLYSHAGSAALGLVRRLFSGY